MPGNRRNPNLRVVDEVFKSPPVLVMTCAHSRFMLVRMNPTRHTQDLLLGVWDLGPVTKVVGASDR
ncbi:hypothetical protein FHU39_003469 [Flexivirga oryzae]|uniref:Uncharacterized protein n=1 Tax=Flexivirga oryzae TaxID=1794944 RepID=A0A839N6Q7_9MICO|nr:hypothetical protein [Flexivirga oryzae]